MSLKRLIGASDIDTHATVDDHLEFASFHQPADLCEPRGELIDLIASPLNLVDQLVWQIRLGKLLLGDDMIGTVFQCHTNSFLAGVVHKLPLLCGSELESLHPLLLTFTQGGNLVWINHPRLRLHHDEIPVVQILILVGFDGLGDVVQPLLGQLVNPVADILAKRRPVAAEGFVHQLLPSGDDVVLVPVGRSEVVCILCCLEPSLTDGDIAIRIPREDTIVQPVVRPVAKQLVRHISEVLCDEGDEALSLFLECLEIPECIVRILRHHATTAESGEELGYGETRA